MRDGLAHDLERAWQILMIYNEDYYARAVAEAMHELMRQNAPSGPRVITRTMEDDVGTKDGAG